MIYETFVESQQVNKNTPINKFIVNVEKSMQNNKNIEYPSIPYDVLMKILKPLAKLELLNDFLTEIYNFNSEHINNNNNKIESNENLIKIQNNSIEDYKHLITNLENERNTNYRFVEEKIYNFEKKQITIEYFKLAVYCSLALVILPILSYYKFISKNVTIILWIMGVISIILYGVYTLFYKDVNRNKKFFDKFNFNKPTKKDIEESKRDIGVTPEILKKCDQINEEVSNSIPEHPTINVQDFKN